MKIIIACRHGESYKNLKNLYGGKGNGLTDVGVTQVKELAKSAKKTITEYKKMLSEQRINYIKNDILMNKLLNFLVENNG